MHTAVTWIRLGRWSEMQRVFFVCFAILLSAPPFTLAQTSGGKILGTAQDSTGGVMPGVSIVVHNIATGTTFKTETGQNGAFIVPALAAGDYSVSVTASGFKQAQVASVKIDVGVPTNIQVQLEVGSQAESVTVEGQGAILQTQSATVSTTLVGRHSLKVGGEARHYALDNYQPNNAASSYAFTGSRTGNAFADFLFGVIDNGNVQVQNAMVSTRAWSYSVFVQDDFKISSDLTLNLGLRWQYDQSFRELHDGLAFFNPYTAEWEQFGVNAPERSFDPSLKQFGPRVGFAWNPTATVVVRGGYGLSYPSAVGHGRAGDGNGMIPSRGYRRPPSFHVDRLRTAPTGHYFDVITNGFGSMPPSRLLSDLTLFVMRRLAASYWTNVLLPSKSMVSNGRRSGS